MLVKNIAPCKPILRKKNNHCVAVYAGRVLEIMGTAFFSFSKKKLLSLCHSFWEYESIESYIAFLTLLNVKTVN